MTLRDGAVLAGGAIGTLGRAGTAELVPVGAGWPWATLGVNLVGTLLLALLVGWAGGRLEPDDLRLRFLATGVLGGFTTFSAFAVEVQQLGLTATGMGYAAVSVTTGLALARLGLSIAARPRTVAP